jgi:hypothetical protein
MQDELMSRLQEAVANNANSSLGMLWKLEVRIGRGGGGGRTKRRGGNTPTAIGRRGGGTWIMK